jgi:allantoin racemase
MPRGPKHLEYLYYQSKASYENLKINKRSRKDVMTQLIIGCFDDLPFIRHREICETMFVAGPAESSMKLPLHLVKNFQL